MRINHFNSIQNNPYKKQTQDVKQDSVKSSYKKDEVQISDEAKKLLSTSKFEQERADKVNEIKRQIESGNYEVNNSKVAKSILDFWRKG
ncbi:flagellar biosynthesis anti-sigma factor FlgM [Fictibacillus phosphorivorans]|uniref:flagellar biosynthesis anti-sigma factor FlgM n=1 Tax=Fictibacillus phosphorivorans TaxID=1221500 RepID=UPI002042620E|nr:flagellar biosynthesis anti-sigma factor FlgM [Fictibacillus phosphorivorans]MCM3718469.1 flagellar biosynthesis anti-sigma factor FlgM [Fictibacillus phosphorivorans]MCM3776175.1 flagellar biosynthesis anti-sigma factor FlgM [Fictibacillus phosphorivorans]